MADLSASSPAPTTLTPELIAEIRRVSLESTFAFGKFVCGFYDMDPDVHVEMARWVEKPTRLKLGQAPRGFFKTTTWTLSDKLRRATKNPNIRILLTNETAENAEKWIGQLQAIVMSPIYGALFPECVPNPLRVKWNSSQLELKRTKHWPEATFEAIGVGGASTSRHYDIICLEQGSLVYTSNGLVPIEDVRIAHRVLTRSGKYSEVTATQVREQYRDMVRVRIWGQPELLSCTSDHQVCCWRDDGVKWIAAGELTNEDWLAMPIPQNKRGGSSISKVDPEIEQIINNAEIWRVIGYWLAEGAATDGNRIRLTFGKKEMDYAFDVHSIVSRHLGVECSITRGESSTLVVAFTHEKFKTILGKFGTHAYNKHLPPFAIAQDRDYRRELVRGYFRGDGCHVGNRWSAVSVSRSLVAGFQLCLASLGINSTLAQAKLGGPAMVVGNLCDTRASYTVASSDPMMHVLMDTTPRFTNMPPRTRIIPGFLLSRVRSVECETRSVRIHDLTVREGESFTVPGVCVHNCNDDLVGKKAREEPTTMQAAIDQRKLAWSLMVDPSKSEIHDFGTRWAPQDLIEWILRNVKGIDHYLVNLRKDDGTSRWPTRFTEQAIEQIRQEQGPEMFALQYLNTAVGSGASKFDPAHLRYWTMTQDAEGNPVLVLESSDGEKAVPLADCTVFQVIDAGLNPESDDARTANIVGALTPPCEATPFDIIILEAKATRSTPYQVLEEAKSTYDRWHPMFAAIETFGGHEAFFYWISEKYPEMRIRKLDKNFSRNAKTKRIIGFWGSYPSQHRVYVSRAHTDLVDELVAFPNGKTVDLLDAAGYLPTIWSPPSGQEKKRKFPPGVTPFDISDDGWEELTRGPAEDHGTCGY